MKALSIWVLTALVSVSLAKQRFDNYKVFSVPVETEEQHKKLELSLGNGDFSLWNEIAVGRMADIMVPPHHVDTFNGMIRSLDLSSSLKVENVQK